MDTESKVGKTTAEAVYTSNEKEAGNTNSESSPILRHSISNFLTTVEPRADRVVDNGSKLVAGASKDGGNVPVTTTPTYSPPSYSPSSDSGSSSWSPPSSISSLFSSMYESRHISTPSSSPTLSNYLPPMSAGLRDLTTSLPSTTRPSILPLSGTRCPTSTKYTPISPPTSSAVTSICLDDSATTLSSPQTNVKTTEDVDKDRTAKRSKRTNFTTSQISKLQQLFEEEPYPDHDAMETIAGDLKMTGKQVKIWFQNKRARHRRRVACSRSNPNSPMIPATPTYFPMTPFDQSMPGNMTLTSLPSLQSAIGFPGSSDQFTPDMKSQLGQWGPYFTNAGMTNEPQRFVQSWNPFWPVAASSISDTHAHVRENYMNMTNTQFTPRQSSWCVSPSYLRQGC